MPRAVISTVQQPGSQPPEDVPALMNILRSTAEEQLSLVQTGATPTRHTLEWLLS